jgi:hypothetical protein
MCNLNQYPWCIEGYATYTRWKLRSLLYSLPRQIECITIIKDLNSISICVLRAQTIVFALDRTQKEPLFLSRPFKLSLQLSIFEVNQLFS